MTHHASRVSLSLFLLAAFAAAPAEAAPIVAGTTDLHGTAIQDITLLPGTLFNGGSTPIFIPDVSGVGTITIDRETQVGSMIAFNSLSGGVFVGLNSMLGKYEFGNVSPLTGSDFSGSITNVVQNSSDPGFATGQPSSFQSGDFTLGGASFDFKFLSGPAAGITLFTDPSVPFQFSSTFDGLPPSPGTVLTNSGPDFLNVTFNGEVVATSSNRRIVLTATPEPSSVALMAAGVVGLCWYRRNVARQKARA